MITVVQFVVLYRCRLVMGDKLPREIENPLYRYLIAISKLRLGILRIEDGGHTVVHITALGAFRPAPPGFPRDTPVIALSPSHACGPCHEEFSAASQLRGPIMMTSNFNVFVL